MTAGMEAAANQGGGNTAVIIGSPGQAAGLAAVAPQKQIASMPVTMKVTQGTPLQVFLVARDLDFAGVAATADEGRGLSRRLSRAARGLARRATTSPT